jgi:hypothetical protein
VRINSSGVLPLRLASWRNGAGVSGGPSRQPWVRVGRSPAQQLEGVSLGMIAMLRRENIADLDLLQDSSCCSLAHGLLAAVG